MTRTARRVATTVVPAVTALASVVAFGTPAQAADSATVTWDPASDSAVVLLNDDAVASATQYHAGFGSGLDDLCGQINGFVNGRRQAAGYAVGLEQSDCIGFVLTCVSVRQGNHVEVTVYADLGYSCRSFG